MASVSWQVPAKVNLSLTVGPLRDDGFHGLATVFHAISIVDVVTASTPSPGRADAAEVVLDVGAAHPAVDVTAVPVDDTNLAARAVRALAERAGRSPSVRLRIHKAIPVAGGLAGGSADAAGALLACNDLWGTGLSTEDLREIAAELGSDVPFAVTGGTSVGVGRGEVLEPVPVGADLHWVVVTGRDGLSTPAVYRRLDDLRSAERTAAPGPLTAPPRLLAALADGDAVRVAAGLVNDLQAAAVDLAPELAETLAAGRAAGASAGIVSGSGPTCVFLAPSAAATRDVADALERDGHAGRVIVASGPRSPRPVIDDDTYA